MISVERYKNNHGENRYDVNFFGHLYGLNEDEYQELLNEAEELIYSDKNTEKMKNPCETCRISICPLYYGMYCRPHEAYCEIEGKKYLDKLKSVSISSKAIPTKKRGSK